MDRDPKTGRFLTGNRAALGNKGNTRPKWGNKSALKHGIAGIGATPLLLEREDALYVFVSKKNSIRINNEHYIKNEDGSISFHDDVVPVLESFGIQLLTRDT